MSLMLLGVMAFFAFANGRIAVASCGDYVMVGGHAQPAEHDSSPGTPVCQGPNCQQQVPLPAAPTKALRMAPTLEAACMAGSAPPWLAFLSGRLFERRHLVAEGHNRPMLRPPSL